MKTTMDLDDIINSWISHANSTELDTNKSQHHFKITYQLYLNILKIRMLHCMKTTKIMIWLFYKSLLRDMC